MFTHVIIDHDLDAVYLAGSIRPVNDGTHVQAEYAYVGSTQGATVLGQPRVHAVGNFPVANCTIVRI